MISERMATILPPLTKKSSWRFQKYTVSAVCWQTPRTLLQERPFRSPHHTVSMAGLAGGGRSIRPGEISLAHHGVLFLDELPEFSKSTMEVLRQPLEEHQIHLTRAVGSVTYPSDFFTSGIYESMQLRILSGPESVQMHTGIPAAVFLTGFPSRSLTAWIFVWKRRWLLMKN